MTDEKKSGLLKRIFSFGMGRNDRDEASQEAQQEEAQKLQEERLAAEQAAQERREQVAAKELAEAEEKARLEAEEEVRKLEVEQAAKAKAEQEAAERAEEERLAQEARDREAAEKAERERLEQEEAERLAAEEAAQRVEAVKQVSRPDKKSKPAQSVKGFEEGGTLAPPPEEIELEESRITLTERKVNRQEPEPVKEEDMRKQGWLKRLGNGLSRSSNQLKENISQVFTGRKLDDDTLQDLEDILIQADLGVETAMKVTDALSDQKFGKEITDEEVRMVMADEIEKVLGPVAQDLDLDLNHQPHVILVVGVNGSGKTTTIGKLASKLYDAGFSTTLVAGDTFRAAAIEQLKIWGERTMSPVLSRPLGSDAAGLAFDAWAETRNERRDVMLMDTAGRLQNKKELMAELEKIVRVLKKQDPTAPHTVLLTLDATTGQNAMNQVEIFKDIAGVNGLVMTKLDGTARGGILVAISARHKLPVYFIGVGEQVEDLEPFEAKEFARSIAGLPREEDA